MLTIVHKIDLNGFVDTFENERINEKTAAKKNIADKLRTSAIYALAYNFLNRTPNITGIEFDAVGKPFFCGENAPMLSLSHSKDMAVMAVNNKPVGVDIEKMRAVNLNCARRFCSENELWQLNTATEKTQMFFMLWCLKEAYYKMCGRVDDIKKTEFYIYDKKVICSNKKIKANIKIIDGYCLAMCYEK